MIAGHEQIGIIGSCALIIAMMPVYILLALGVIIGLLESSKYTYIYFP